MDSSPLIVFDAIGRLDLLSSPFDEVLVPNAVWDEVAFGSDASKRLRHALPEPYRRVNSPQCADTVGRPGGLGKGETEAIALARMYQGSVLILDDEPARRAAGRVGITMTGSAGILLLAKSAGLIEEVAPLLDRFIEIGLRISVQLRREILARAGE